MYDSEFQAAQQSISQFRQTHRKSALGPMAEAAMYLFEQFEHTQVLRTDFFSKHGTLFGHKLETAPDLRLARRFHAALAETDRLAAETLKRSPEDGDALLARALGTTLRADYDALIAQNGLEALKEIKQATGESKQLEAACSSCYDAKLASGVENYILGKEGGMQRFFLDLTGAQTNESQGLKDLEVVADKGRFFGTYAKVLLAIAAMRDKDGQKASNVMTELVHEYPGNQFFQAALAGAKS